MRSEAKRSEAQQNSGQINFFNVFCPTDTSTNGNLVDQQPESTSSTSNVASNGSIYKDTLFKSDKNMRPCLRCAASHKKCEMMAGSTICAHCQKHGFTCIPKVDMARGKGRKKQGTKSSGLENASMGEQRSTPDNTSVIHLSKSTFLDSTQNEDFFSMWTDVLSGLDN